MEPQHNSTEEGSRQAAIHGLAIVGFLALIVLGIVLAIYAARYVPSAVSRLVGGNPETTLTTVPTTTVPFTEPTAATSTGSTQAASTTVTAAATTTTVQATSSAATSGAIVGYRTVTSNTYTPGSIAIPANRTYTGLADLAVTITDVGYTDNGEFVSDRSLARNDALTVKILVTNIGTNKTGDWTIHTVIPTSSKTEFVHDEQEPSLEPNGILPLTLTLTRGRLRTGDNQEIFVQVDSENDINESNENNNEDTATINVN
jgi:hypothetical protein